MKPDAQRVLGVTFTECDYSRWALLMDFTPQNQVKPFLDRSWKARAVFFLRN